MNLKRLLLIAGIIVALVILVFLIVFRIAYKPPKEREEIPIPTPVRIPAQKINISGVEVNNFLAFPIATNVKGDALFVKEEDYQIVYLKPFNQFVISILGSPFNSVRKKAEARFLTNLNISQEQACKLKVQVSTPNFANPDYAGRKYVLSFCQK